MRHLARNVVNGLRDLDTRLRSVASTSQPVGIVKHVGVGHRPGEALYYRSLSHFRSRIPLRRKPDHFDFLLCQSFVDSEFINCHKPKVFFTKEPPALMQPETVQLMKSERFRQFAYLFDEPNIDDRMFFPCLPSRMGRTLRRLDRSICEPRYGYCCIINRYSENVTLNLVQERTRFVQAMGPDIDIYGRPPWSGENKWERFPNYLGSVDDKLAVMRRYTFALVFENTDHAGYVSEKILDALCAGAIPLYWGGGDFLTQCIPDDCFIDCRTVLPDDLHARLKELPFDQITRYRKAGLGFLRSPAASRFTWRYFADAVTKRFEMQQADNEER